MELTTYVYTEVRYMLSKSTYQPWKGWDIHFSSRIQHTGVLYELVLEIYPYSI